MYVYIYIYICYVWYIYIYIFKHAFELHAAPWAAQAGRAPAGAVLRDMRAMRYS